MEEVYFDEIVYGLWTSKISDPDLNNDQFTEKKTRSDDCIPITVSFHSNMLYLRILICMACKYLRFVTLHRVGVPHRFCL